MSDDLIFWIGFALLAVPTGFGSFRLFVLYLSIPAFTAALVRLLNAKDLDRYQRLLRAAGHRPASVVARRAFELRDKALTHDPGGDIVIGYRDRAPAVDFVASLRELIAPDLEAERWRIRWSWVLAATGFLAPIWLSVMPPASTLGPMIATALLVLVSIHTSYRARVFSRGLDRLFDAIAPLLDPRPR